jgi:hypothetical protein
VQAPKRALNAFLWRPVFETKPLAERQRQTRLQMLHWSMLVACLSHSNRTTSTASDSAGMNDRARSIYSQLASQLASKLPRRINAAIPVRHHRK